MNTEIYMSKISLQMYTLRDFTQDAKGLQSTVARLAKLGFRNLQYSVPPFMGAAEVKALFDGYGINADLMSYPAAQIEKNLPEIIGQCDLFNTRDLRIDSIPGDMTTPAGFKEYAHELNRLGGLLAPYDIKLIYHFHSFEFISYGGENGMDIFLRETDPERIFIQPDTFWIASAGISPSDYISEHRDRVRYVHAKDYAITKRGESSGLSPVRFAEVGQGNLDWKKIIAVCESFGCEYYIIEQDECYGRDPFECAALSMANLRRFGIE
jgi:sugar phosphate isomerase/epimerase